MPLLLSTRPMEATVIPFPTLDTTPPVTKMYLTNPNLLRKSKEKG